MKVVLDNAERYEIELSADAKGAQFTLFELHVFTADLLAAGFDGYTPISVWDGDEDEGTLASAHMEAGRS